MEIWRDMVNCDAYMVSSHGRVMRKDSGKIYGGIVNSKGYVRFDLSKNGKRFVVFAHRAVAEAFIPKVQGKEAINHKDGNKTNNTVENLEWCTPKENSIHAFRVLKRKQANRRSVICLETGAVYESIKQAERETGINNVLIYRCCCGKRNKTHELHWEYADLV